MSFSDMSVAMAYINRVPQLRYTLKTFRFFGFDGEIVICDDFSEQDQRAGILIPEFPDLNIKIVDSPRNVINPCVAYNKAFSECSGDYIIIQNPECCWVDNIAQYVRENLSTGKYIPFNCFPLTKEVSESLDSPQDIQTFAQMPILSWYQHPIYRPLGYHFCSAITRSDLEGKLGGGFDEAYSEGHSYDDDEFYFRVRQHLEVKFTMTHRVAHQFHPPNTQYPNLRELVERNKLLFQDLVNSHQI